MLFRSHKDPLDLPDRVRELERIRKEVASRHGVSARSIISDKQLKEFARAQPRSVDECALIAGLQTIFIQKYAHEFIAAGAEARARAYAHEQETQLDDRQRKVLELVRNGFTLAAVAAKVREPEGIVAGAIHDMIKIGRAHV